MSLVILSAKQLNNLRTVEIKKQNKKKYYIAIKYFNNAIKANPKYPNAFLGRGIAKNQIGDDRGAIADYNKAIKLDPNYARAYLGRGLSKKLLGDIDEACLDLSKAGELGYDDAYRLIQQYCN